MMTDTRQGRKAIMNLLHRFGFWFLLLMLTLGCLGFSPARAQQTPDPKGLDEGNYNIKQSVEFGYRFTSIDGDQQTYDTFVNLQQGPRLLGFTTEANSLDHHGTFFDRLYFSNFGYGGDPNNVSQLRISKNKWYAFDGMFRKDQNHWDYSLLSNPLNAPTLMPNAPPNFNPVVNAPSNVVNTALIGTSPAAYYTTRNMQDYRLTILPDSKVRFRVGYDQNTMYGPGFSTTHEGTDQYLTQDYSIHNRNYRLGVDFRFLPRTTISYDQVWSYYKNDLGSTDTNLQFSPGVGFPSVDLGVPWNTSSQPCSNTFAPGAIVNPACNAFSAYLLHWRTRLDSPTEKVTVQSTYFKNLEFAGTFSYTAGDLSVDDYQQNYAGLTPKANLSNFGETGPINGRHVATFADFGVTWHINEAVSLVDSVRFSNWKEPAQFTATDCSFFSPSLIVNPNIFSPTATLPGSCAAPANGVLDATPMHNGSSGGDIALNLDSNFLKQQDLSNTIQIRVQINPKAGAYFGYEYRARVISDNFFNSFGGIYYPDNAARGNCAPVDAGLPISQANLPAGCALNPDGSISYSFPGTYAPPSETDINENHAIFGLWIHPSSKLRVSVDGNIMSANRTFTNLSPLTSQEIRIKANYRAASWVSLNGNASLWYGQNDVPNVNGLQHNLSYGAAAQFVPSEKLNIDLGYNYNNISSQILVCFTASGSLAGLPACPDVAGLVQELSPYSSKVNTGFLDFSWNPISRLTIHGGANLSSVSGSQLNLTPQNPIPTNVAGSLNSNWYEPYGGFDFRFTSHWTGKAFWDYYSYHEDPTAAYQDVYASRNFHGNLVTLSVRYAF
jgi:opacity protein-like surface antigen